MEDEDRGERGRAEILGLCKRFRWDVGREERTNLDEAELFLRQPVERPLRRLPGEKIGGNVGVLESVAEKRCLGMARAEGDKTLTDLQPCDTNRRVHR